MDKHSNIIDDEFNDLQIAYTISTQHRQLSNNIPINAFRYTILQQLNLDELLNFSSTCKFNLYLTNEVLLLRIKNELGLQKSLYDELNSMGDNIKQHQTIKNNYNEIISDNDHAIKELFDENKLLAKKLNNNNNNRINLEIKFYNNMIKDLISKTKNQKKLIEQVTSNESNLKILYIKMSRSQCICNLYDKLFTYNINQSNQNNLNINKCLVCQHFISNKNMCDNCSYEKTKFEESFIACNENDIKNTNENSNQNTVNIAVQNDITKCFKCNKRIGYSAIKCKCNFQQCNKHKFQTEHECNFDQYEDNRNKLEISNPKINKNKFDKLE